MKRLHRKDLYGWSVFDEGRDIDFHSVLWVRAGGNVAIDPLPLSEHDQAHLERLGSVSTIVVTNSDHRRASMPLAEATGGIHAEIEANGDHLVPGSKFSISAFNDDTRSIDSGCMRVIPGNARQPFCRERILVVE